MDGLTADEVVARFMGLVDAYVDAVLAGESEAALDALFAEVERVVAVARQAYASWLVGDPMAPELDAAVEAWIGFDPAVLAAAAGETDGR